MTRPDIAQSVARSLDDAALSDRLRMIAENVRAFEKVQRSAFLSEASARILEAGR